MDGQRLFPVVLLFLLIGLGLWAKSSYESAGYNPKDEVHDLSPAQQILKNMRDSEMQKHARKPESIPDRIERLNRNLNEKLAEYERQTSPSKRHNSSTSILKSKSKEK
jgi:hypothetical protein